MSINDKRKLSISWMQIVDGLIVLRPAGVLWQDSDGKLMGCQSWIDLLIPNQSGSAAQAQAKGVSLLEWTRQRLSTIPYLATEAL
jgi:hypothetical protein